MKKLIVLLLGLSLLATASVPAQRAPKRVTTRQTPEEQKKLFSLPPGFEIELVAAEPLVINPITMTLDDKGRIYVSESHTYRFGPSGSPIKPYTNPVVRLDPQPGGKGLKHVVVCEGFEDPVMGLAIRDGKLWVTANNYLYRYDLAEDGKTSKRTTLLTDRNKAWNPFGMFVLEWGPDGLLYMSVGNHNIDLRGPTNRVTGKGGSGIILRMKPDGSGMERLVHGLRVPYSFEYDPFGQLWLLSNGQGNPDRFVRVIDGVDYHCYSRGRADDHWLSGRHPLAPPCFELPSGACTQLIRYYGAAYPTSYTGNLFLDNWGAHGFDGANRAIFRYVPDERGKIVAKHTFLSCRDPHFRPSHILLDPDGSLLVADWYGRDDESDRTGRIWRVKYTGKDRPAVKHAVASAEWSKTAYALSALASPHHLVREKAGAEFVKKGNAVVSKLAEHAAKSEEGLGAANALWALLRIGTPEAFAGLARGAESPDWRVRRLTLNVLRRHRPTAGAAVAKKLSADPDSAVRVEAALALTEPKAIRAALLDALEHGAARDEHLRYEAAWHLARHADKAALSRLLGATEPALRLAGLIAIDVACYEGFATKPIALEALAKALRGSPRGADFAHVLKLAQMNWDKSLAPELEKLVRAPDVPAAVVARSLLLLRANAPERSRAIMAKGGKQFLEAVKKGEVRLTSSSDALLVLDLLEAEGPTDFALKEVARHLTSNSAPVRGAAHDLARRFGPKAGSLAKGLWPRVLNAKTRPEDRIQLLATLARVEAKPSKDRWEQVLVSPDATLRAEAVRWWRGFAGQAEMVEVLKQQAPELIKRGPAIKEDLAIVLSQLGTGPEVIKALGLTAPTLDRKTLPERTKRALAAQSPREKQRRSLQGRMVFERSACVKCHTAVLSDTLLAPSLKGIGKTQKVDYLIESILEPSKVIKTGFETERIVTRKGKVLLGLVKDEGTRLRVLNADLDVRINKSEVEERAIQKLSIMPEGQEKLLSRRELEDLIAYLLSLR